jgi:predicted peroxiredoxin
MKKLALLFVAGLILVSCNPVNQEDTIEEKEIIKDATTENVRDGVFIHITEAYDDPHRVLMPLKMATMMAQDKDVLVYMDIHAVELLVREAEDLEYKDFESLRTYISMLNEKNVGVYACPTCLEIAGFTPDDLMEGVQVAAKDKFFDFTKGRIITLDY